MNVTKIMTETADQMETKLIDTDNSNTPINFELMQEFIEGSSGNSAAVLQNLLSSEYSNPLRQTFIDQYNNQLLRKIKGKVKAGKVVIPQQLTADQQLKLSNNYQELDITFSGTTANSHAFAAASRVCERRVLINKIGYDLNTDQGKVLVKDIGGNPISSIRANEKNIHVCAPLLDQYDCTRSNNRLSEASVMLANGIFSDDRQYALLLDYVSRSDYLTSSEFSCFDRSQDCHVRAAALLLLHSCYDISLEALGDAMDTAQALVAYGSFIYSSRVITDDHGIIPDIDAQYEIERNLLGRRSVIRFGFVGCNGFNYEHRYSNYIAYLTRSQFSSTRGSQFSLELLENRCGVQYFRVSRMANCIGNAITHRLYMDHLKGKYIVRFPLVSYFFKRSTIRYPAGGNCVSKDLQIDSTFWRNLPRTTEWVYYEVDADVVDRTCAFVLGATEDKFKPEQIITYIRSITTREIMYSSVVVRRDLPRLDDLSALTYAIYMSLYHAKYNYGKTLQQAILNTNALRSSTRPKDVLGEYDRKFRWWRYLMCLPPAHRDFDPSLLIIQPSEYLEIKTSTGGHSRLLNPETAHFSAAANIIVSDEVKKVVPLMTNKLIKKNRKPNVTKVPTTTNPVKSIKRFCNGVRGKFNYYKFMVTTSSIKSTADPRNNEENFSDTSANEPLIDSKVVTDSNISSDSGISVAPPRTSRKIKRKAPPPPNLLVDPVNDVSSDNIAEESVNEPIFGTTTEPKPDMYTLFDDYHKECKKTIAPSYKCHHAYNRSAWKFAEMIKYINMKAFDADIVDLGGAPGGFITQLLNLNISADRITTVSLPDIQYYSTIKESSVKIIIGDLREVSLTGKYSLVLADAAVESSYLDDSLVKREWDMAKTLLEGSGSLLIKHNNYYSDGFQELLRDMSKYFETIDVYKPYHSLITNSEIYVIGNGFNTESNSTTQPRWIEPMNLLKNSTINITRAKDCCDYCNDDLINRDRFGVARDYPRMGIFNPVTKLIDVDGSRTECCILAACEDRRVSTKTIRDRLIAHAGNNATNDFKHEVMEGNKGGSALLEVMASCYGVRFTVTIDGSSSPYVIPFPTNRIPARTINLRLHNDHYYIINKCNRQSPVNYRRDYMYEPLNMGDLLAKCHSHISFLEKDWGFINTNPQDGCYFYNNLTKYCSVHDECRNDGLLTAIERLTKHMSCNMSFLMIFDKANYSIEYTEKLLKDNPLVAIRYLDIRSQGYFTAIVYLSSTKPTYSVKNDYIHYMAHKCSPGKHNYINPERNIMYTCSADSGHKLIGKYASPDMFIRIKRKPSDAEFRTITPRTIEYAGTGDGAKATNIPLIAKDLLDYLSHRKTTTLNVITLESDYTNIDTLVTLVQNHCHFLSIISSNTAGKDAEFGIAYVPDLTTLDRRKNAMTEMFSLWYRERYMLEQKLSADYETALGVVNKGDKVSVLVDNSLCIFDTIKASFVYGVKPAPGYAWGYSNGTLVATSGLFDITGRVNRQVCKGFATKGMKYIAFSSASRLVHGITLSSQFSIESVKHLKDIPITFVQGVPGGGKTTFILNRNEAKTRNLILTVTREAKDDMRARAKSRHLLLPPERIRTIDSFLLNYAALNDVDEVWIDEALLVHCGVWSWVAYLSGCKSLVIVGDMAQIPYINRLGVEVHYNTPDMWDMKRELLPINYRNPLDIVYWLDQSKFYDFAVRGTSSIQKSVTVHRINGIAEVPIRGINKYLTFTQAEKTCLQDLGYDTSTIHEYQGSQCDDVALVRLNVKESDTIYTSKPHILVALTRHRKSFKYYTITEDMTFMIVAQISSYNRHLVDSVKISLAAGGRTVIPDRSIVLYKEDKLIRNILIDNGGCGYQNWHYEKTYDTIVDTIPPALESTVGHHVLQEYVDRFYPGSSSEFREHDHLIFEHYGITANPSDVSVSMSVPTVKKYDRLQPNIRSTIQYPLHKSQRVALKAFFERNGNVPQLQGLIVAYSEARHLLDDLNKLSSVLVDFSDKPIQCDFRGLEEWLSGQPPSMRAVLESSPLFQDTEWSLYEFIIKTIPKIDLDLHAQYRYKAPQTIAYQPKIVNSVYCPILKELADRFNYGLHDDIILYNGMSVSEFSAAFTNRLPPARYRNINKFLEIDFSKYDKSQGLVILIFEAMLMEQYGVSPRHIAYWILMHRYTKLRDRDNKITAYVEYQRKSGDASTWRFNTIVQLALLNRVLKLYEKVYKCTLVACLSGDDSLLFMDELPVDIDLALRRLQLWYNMEAKLMKFAVPYFCSKFLLLCDDHWIFVPDTIKLVVKLGRADLVDYDHVEAYRVSFDDNLYYYKFPQYWNYISYAINDRYKQYGEHDILYRSLVTVASDIDRFAALYYRGIGHVDGVVSSKPKLEL